jgi:transcription elongation factor Elf1
MERKESHPIPVPSESVKELFDALSVLPRLTNCRRCGTELLHLDATFFSNGRRVWTLPLPFCSNCGLEASIGTNAAWQWQCH